MSKERSSEFAWTKARRNGNDELPTDRAVKIIRTSRAEESPANRSPKKQTVTKVVVSRLVYEPKRNPTNAVVKSIHYGVPHRCTANKKEVLPVRDQLPAKKADRSRPEFTSADLNNDFIRKKLERQKDIDEIQVLLNGISAEQEPVKGNFIPEKNQTAENTVLRPEMEVAMNIVPTATQRSRTDPTLSARTRSKSSTVQQSSSRSKSSSNVGKSRRSESEDLAPTEKKKGYDPDKAKQFMQEQQERRRAQYKTVATQKVISQAGREAIKKRLEDLRKNTMNILNKNLKKVRKKPSNAKMTRPAESEPPTTAHELPAKPQTTGESAPNPWQVATQKKTKVQPHTKALQAANKDHKPEKPLVELKKIGLLRKTSETPQIEPIFSLNDFGMDKENIVLHMKPTPQPSSVHAELPAAMPDIELNVPDVKLQSRTTYCEKSTQFELPATEKPPLPYWLQPTPVQVYPYNFIMAVRKKLEAITNPVQAANQHETTKKSMPEAEKLRPSLSLPTGARRRLLRRPDYDEFSSINADPISGHKLSTASSVLTAFLNSPTTSPKKSMPAPTKTDMPPVELLKSHSDVTSSVTVNIPLSNTISEVSSIHSEVVTKHPPQMSSTRISRKSRNHKNDDDTTASSSVFSSPEKRPHAPKASINSVKEFNINELSPLSVNNINNLNLKSKSSSKSQIDEQPDVDFTQLLQDFNKSLSQVIEVNQQLQSSLSKSPRSGAAAKMNIPAAQRGSKSSKSDNYYSSDFEEAAASDKTANKPSEPEEILTTQSSNRSSSTGSTVETVSKATTRPDPPAISESTYFLSSASLIDTNRTPQAQNVSEELFPDSIEEMSKSHLKLSSPQKAMDLNNFSKDSLDFAKENASHETPRSNQDIIRNHINLSRGNNYRESKELNIFVSQPSESKQLMSDSSIAHHRILNSSIGSDIFAVFNQSELEVSIISQSSRLSESHLNYSTLGLYEQLLKTESTKTEYLTALLKIREKSILDRTRGQIALLEIQKEKCKAKGLIVQISTIKKKQRAILMKMEKEREEIKRILRSNEWDAESHKKKPLRTTKLPELTADLSLRKSLSNAISQTKSSAIVRGFELDTGNNLESILKEREKELYRRREHVERLVKWHQRLDKEELEVLRIEQMLFEYNQQKQPPQPPLRKPIEQKRQKKIIEIDKSLKELQSISSSRSCDEASHRQSRPDFHDIVRTSGGKLNKLWRRLTGRIEMKFDQAKKYKLSKEDLEKLYEEAKRIVLEDFDQNEDKDEMKVLVDQSRVHSSTQSLNSSRSNTQQVDEEIIPNLNLNFSSAGASESERGPSSNSLNITFTNVEFDEKVFSDTSGSQQPVNEDLSSGKREVEYTASFTSFDERQSATENIDFLDAPLITSVSSAIATTPSKSAEDVDLTVIVNSSCTPETKEDLSSTKSDEEEMQRAANISQEVITQNGTVSNEEQSTPESNSPPSNTELDNATPNSPQLNSDITLEDIAFQENNSEATCHEISTDSETMLDDITQPNFESTVVDTKSLAEELISAESSPSRVHSEQQDSHDAEEESETPTELEKRLIDLDESLKGLHQTFERALSPDKTTTPPPSNNSPSPNHFEADEDKENRPLPSDSSATKLTVKDYLLNPDASTNRMPDIINEVEIRRRQQILIESDIKQLENAVPYVLLREIPNKPPPPYVPPAHGSPMTTIFPSEARIKEITFRRTGELYEEINAKNNPSEKPASILDENITNIYERIILDICKECVRDYQPTFTANSVLVGNYKMPLALYNPPDRLKCLQEFVYKQVRKLLAMDKKRPRYNSIFSLGRRKRDHVDEILIQELFEEEHKWTNFDLEESEVKASVIDEILNDLVKEVIDDFEVAYNKKKNEVLLK